MATRKKGTQLFFALALGLALVPVPAVWSQTDPDFTAPTKKIYYGRPPVNKETSPPAPILPAVVDSAPAPILETQPNTVVPAAPLTAAPALPPVLNTPANPVPPPVPQFSVTSSVPKTAPSPVPTRTPNVATPPAPPPVVNRIPAPRPASFATGAAGDHSLQQVAFQMKHEGRFGQDKGIVYNFQQLPGPEDLFRAESEQALKERIRQEVRDKEGVTSQVLFPEEVVVSTEVYMGRNFPRAIEYVEPNYVCFNRLYFQQINTERHGWDLGIFQPVAETGKFYWDAFFLPYHMGTDVCRHYECNAGYCLPGDPAPFLLYPPKLSATGLAAQAGALTGGFFIFP
jgi:hypothetical protein